MTHGVGTITQGGNQMPKTPEDPCRGHVCGQLLFFHLFLVLLLTACWAKPESIRPPHTLVLLQTQMIQAQRAPLYHPGVLGAPLSVSSNSSPSSTVLKLSCPPDPLSLQDDLASMSLKNSHSTWHNKMSHVFTLKCLLPFYPFSKEERFLFFSRPSPLLVCFPGPQFHQLSAFSSSVPFSLLLFLTPLLPRNMPNFPLNSENNFLASSSQMKSHLYLCFCWQTWFTLIIFLTPFNLNFIPLVSWNHFSQKLK